LKELEKLQSEPGFWENPNASQKTIAEYKSLKAVVDPYQNLLDEYREEIGLLELADPRQDAAVLDDAAQKEPLLQHRAHRITLQAVFSDPEDFKPCFMAIHAGAGGTDACDWVSILLRMYLRWCQRNGFTATLIDDYAGEEAGLRYATLHIEGPYAFGYLKGEIGVHRLVRISPFDANKRRHTSFASVDVVAEQEEIEVSIDETEIRIDTFSAGGPGGQHVNKTQSAVRITHLPTGIVVSCQNERSQQMNRKMAMKVMLSKLHQNEEAKRKEAYAKIYGDKGEISFGYQIRSYVLHPYTLVKDHRTGLETGKIQAILDGEDDLDEFVEAFLRWKGRTY
jgi:peptide chain release factor 2